MLSEVKAPKKYAPPSPIKILAFGKLKSKNVINTIIWAVMSVAKFVWLLSKFIIIKIILIIIKWMDKRPLKPSIRLDPLIINKKHNKTKTVMNNLELFKILNKK